MPKYKNLGITSKKVYGVMFKPGETHEVSGYINNTNFIRVDESTPVSSNKSQEKPSSGKDTAKPSDKKQEISTESKKSDAIQQVIEGKDSGK